ncbi:hypothetical protein BVI434_3390003 [Burkholderia vietnamiensis]|nr:hypothetical protein BVI434_3390003 [Burkholderia vietnamiensis]
MVGSRPAAEMARRQGPRRAARRSRSQNLVARRRSGLTPRGAGRAPAPSGPREPQLACFIPCRRRAA